MGFAAGGSRSITYTFEAATSIDCLCLFKHNLFNQCDFVSISYDAGTDYIELARITPSSSAPIMLAFANVIVDQIRITIEAPIAPIYISNISVGLRHRISEGQYIGFQDPTYGVSHELVSNRTRSNELVGLVRQRKAVETTIEAKHLTESWVDANWPTLYEHIARYPFYLQWREDKQAAYCVAIDIAQPRFTTLNRLAFSLKVQVY